MADALLSPMNFPRSRHEPPAFFTDVFQTVSLTPWYPAFRSAASGWDTVIKLAERRHLDSIHSRFICNNPSRTDWFKIQFDSILHSNFCNSSSFLKRLERRHDENEYENELLRTIELRDNQFEREIERLDQQMTNCLLTKGFLFISHPIAYARVIDGNYTDLRRKILKFIFIW